MRQFDFGENWSEFSDHALTPERVREAKAEFSDLIRRAGADLAGAGFLDIGFGQGLSLLSAAGAGALAVGCDINPKCAQVLERNRRLFPELGSQEIPVVVGSILDRSTVDALRARSPDGQGFRTVHSWGVLHHTGRMWQAIDHAASLVANGGTLVVALYDRHWTSPIWYWIKRAYVGSPSWLQRALIGIMYPVILLAKWAVTRRNPMQMERGMDFYYNVVDWVGGFPYEYASIDEVTAYLAPRGFVRTLATPAIVPTGCHELAFRRAG